MLVRRSRGRSGMGRSRGCNGYNGTRYDSRLVAGLPGTSRTEIAAVIYC